MKTTAVKKHQPSGILSFLFRGTLMGLVAGYLLAFVLGQSVWLEMRVNIGWALPALTVLSAVFFSWRRMELFYGWFLLLQLICLLTFFLIYGFSISALFLLPACLLREGCALDIVKISQVNLALLFVLIAGNGWWILRDMRNRKGNKS